jgi:hypothetical protein
MTDLAKEKTSEITIEQLRASIDETSIMQKPLNGIRHIDLIDGIIDLTKQRKLKPELGVVTIQNGGASRLPGISLIPYFEKDFGSNDTRSMIIRRLYTSIMLKDQDDVQRMGIAFTFTQEGICIAIGPNVSICSNWCIYGAEQFATTYRNELAVPADKLLDIVGGWMNSYDRIAQNTMAMKERMMAIPVFTPMAEQFFGRLQLARVATDKGLFRNGVYPMNQSQINQFSEDYLQYTIDHIEEPTLWDFYNIGTNLRKPKEMELPNLLPQNLKLGSAITEFFSLN